MRCKKVFAGGAVAAVAAVAAVVGAGAIMATRGASASPVLFSQVVGPDPGAVALDARAGHVFVANRGNTLSMLDANDGRVLRTVTLNSAPASLAVDTRRGHLLVDSLSFSVGAPNSVTTIDTRTGSILRATDVGQGASAIALDQGAGRAYVANSQDDTMSTLDLASGRTLRTVPVGFDHTTGYDPVAIAADLRAGHIFTANSGNNSISMFDAASGRLLRVTHLGKPMLNGRETFGAHSLAVSETDGHLFVGGNTPYGSGGAVRTLDTRSGAVIRTVGVSWDPGEIAMDTRTGRVFVPNGAGPGLLLDARTGAVAGAIGWSSGSWSAGDGMAVDERTGLVYRLAGAAIDNTGAAVGTGRLLAFDGKTGALVRAVLVGLLPRDLALDSRTGHVFVSSLSDLEFNRYGYRTRAGGGSGPWGWVPQPIRGWLPHAPSVQPPPSGPINGAVSVIDTTR